MHWKIIITQENMAIKKIKKLNYRGHVSLIVIYQPFQSTISLLTIIITLWVILWLNIFCSTTVIHKNALIDQMEGGPKLQVAINLSHSERGDPYFWGKEQFPEKKLLPTYSHFTVFLKRNYSLFYYISCTWPDAIKKMCTFCIFTCSYIWTFFQSSSSPFRGPPEEVAQPSSTSSSSGFFFGEDKLMHRARLRVQSGLRNAVGGQSGGGGQGGSTSVGARLLNSRLLGNLNSLSSVKRSRTFNVSDVNDVPNGHGKQ